MRRSEAPTSSAHELDDLVERDAYVVIEKLIDRDFTLICRDELWRSAWTERGAGESKASLPADLRQ